MKENRLSTQETEPKQEQEEAKSPEEQQLQYEVDMVKKGVESGAVELPSNFESAEEWVKSARETRATLTKLQQEKAQPAQTEESNEGEANSEASQNDAAASLSDIADSLTSEEEDEAADNVDWEAVQQELAQNGSLSEEQLLALRKRNIPDTMIQAAIAGFKAQQQAVTQAASEIAGGEEKLGKVRDWAKKNFPKEKLASIAEQLKQPGWEFALRGLVHEYDAAQSKNAEPESLQTAGVGHGQPTVKPWGSQQEMMAHMRDPRYRHRTDPEFIKMVEARTQAMHLANQKS